MNRADKAVLIPIQPYYVFLIIARLMGWDIPQEKTIEVRKDFPKNSAWNKVVYIYCGKNKKSFNQIPKQYQPLMTKFLGEVIGEFMCDRIMRFTKRVGWLSDIQNYDISYDHLKETCLEGLWQYGKGKPLYGWHISELKIYAEPKKLSEFKAWRWECETVESQFEHCRFGYAHEAHCELCKWIRFAPQSWRYVEELKAQ